MVSTGGELKTGSLDKVDLSDEYIYEQALRITEVAEKSGIPLRLIGATAFISHCPKYNYLYKGLQRRLTDVDLMTYSKIPQNELDLFFKGLGFEPIRSLGWHAGSRDIYVNGKKLYIDVFKDKLSYCHTISFIGRLELDYPTVPLTEMLLGKLQIVEINAKDLFDIVVVFLEHDVGSVRDNDREMIDLDRILGIWSRDWGFNYTGITNLEKAISYAGEMDLNEKERELVRSKIRSMIGAAQRVPKTMGWKIRSLIGSRVRWYEEVESVER